MFSISLKSPATIAIALVLAVSAVAIAVVSSEFTGSIGAEKYFIQSAAAQAPRSKVISAELRRSPSPGDLLIAVVTNATPTAFIPTGGWEVAINESDASPGQTILYRFAGAQEPSKLTVGGFQSYTDLALQVFEYRGLEVHVPPVLTRSSSGNGTEMTIEDFGSGEKDAIAIVAASIDGRGYIRHWKPSEFEPRRDTQTRGSGAVSVSAGEYYLPKEHLADVSAVASTHTDWRMQAVMFSLASSLDAAALGEEENPAEDIEFSVVVDNNRPKEMSDITYTIEITNDGEEAITNLEVGTELPKDVQLVNAVVQDGWYLPYSDLWFISELAPSESATLAITAKVEDETARTSFLFKPSVLFFDQYVEGEVDVWDAASVEVQKLTFDERIALESECTEVSEPSFTINNGESETTDPTVTVQGSASGATYALYNTRADITSAALYPLSGASTFILDEALGEKEIYAWFGNYCDRSPITSATIELIEVEVEEENEDEDASEDVDDSDEGEPEEEAEQSEGLEEEQDDAEEEVSEEDEDPFEQETEEDGFAEDGEGEASQEEEDVQSDPEEVGSTIPAACAPATPFVSYLYAGSTGSEVERLQQVLTCLGYYSAEVDGVFDANVTQSLIQVQSAYGLTVSGAMNLSTRELLSGY